MESTKMRGFLLLLFLGVIPLVYLVYVESPIYQYTSNWITGSGRSAFPSVLTITERRSEIQKTEKDKLKDVLKPTQLAQFRRMKSSALAAFRASQRVYERYRTILKAYESKLADLPRYEYKPKENFIDYGQPVANILPKRSGNVKKILQWTGFFGFGDWIPLNITCPNNVVCLTSRNKSDVLDSDAIVMHSWDVHDYHITLPKQRLPYQRWVYFCLEGPYLAKVNVHNYNGVFNWTMNYRKDADVNALYIETLQRSSNLSENEFQELYKSIYQSKTKVIAQMNSNCRAPHTNRLGYVRDLQKHMTVDTYGKCGVLNCPRDETCNHIMRQYKFYMSLENSNCREYITEKAAKPLYEWYSVPVVMGGADPGDYERKLPPNSYIHSAGFNSTKELAEYLLLLDKNPHLYEKYHRWRITQEGGDTSEMVSWCKLCQKLHNDSLPVQSYRDFSGWYREDVCKI